VSLFGCVPTADDALSSVSPIDEEVVAALRDERQGDLIVVRRAWIVRLPYRDERGARGTLSIFANIAHATRVVARATMVEVARNVPTLPVAQGEISRTLLDACTVRAELPFVAPVAR
jgi:hypothetical protein